MHYKKFTSESEIVHKKFVCNEFGIDYTDMGVDFLVGRGSGVSPLGIELKCKKRYRKTVTFVCSAAQVTAWEERYGKENLLWMFMLYDLGCPVSSIRGRKHIETQVIAREIWILPWSFIYSPAVKLHTYESWGHHYHFTTKNFPVHMDKLVLSGVTYHYVEDVKTLELFDRRAFLQGF